LLLRSAAPEPLGKKMYQDKLEFVKSNRLHQFDLPIEGQKEPFSMSNERQVRLALSAILDVRNHPVLVHCDKGKHRTGTVIGCLRKLQGWALSAVFDEYARMCKKSTRIMDHQLIEFFTMEFSLEERRHLPDWLQK
jgi:tyrosine-protein phosphatase SIW14